MVHPQADGGAGPTANLKHVHLCTGLLARDGHVLLVASRYPNHSVPLWNLPGGRQAEGELATQTVAREVFEETGLRAQVGELLYVSESYDGDTHFTNFTFAIQAAGEPRASTDPSDHIVAAEMVPIADLSRMTVEVVRAPLHAYLTGTLTQRYRGYAEARVSVEWD